MTGLLISVRDAEEARAALAGGAGLVDIKEPLHGSLGAASSEQLQAVAKVVRGKAPLSAALGELSDNDGPDASALEGFSFAKIGLAGALRFHDWPQRWAARMEQLPAGVRPVAVVYADWRTVADTPSPDAILEHAPRLACQALLIDTRQKNAGGLLQHWPMEELAAWLPQVRQAGLTIVLGGSLTLEQLPRIAPLEPDWVAVRGAACEGDRVSRISQRRVGELAESLREAIAGRLA